MAAGERGHEGGGISACPRSDSAASCSRASGGGSGWSLRLASTTHIRGADQVSPKGQWTGKSGNGLVRAGQPGWGLLSGAAGCGSVNIAVMAGCSPLLCLRPGSAGLQGASELTSIERTAYPQFRRLTTARVLHVFFTPTEDEAAWARERTETPEALLALLVDLKCFQKMARFCSREENPQAVTDHVRHCLGLAPETEPGHGAARTAKWHRGQVRRRQGVTYDQRRARALAEAAIREAAQVRNHPPDLINVALERIIEASLELPAYSTLDEMAASIRAEVNEAIFAGIVARMGAEGRRASRSATTWPRCCASGSRGLAVFWAADKQGVRPR